MMMDFYMRNSCMENMIVKEFDCTLIITRDDHWFYVFDKIQLYQQSLQLDTFSNTVW
jgi:hypothetical protein